MLSGKRDGSAVKHDAFGGRCMKLGPNPAMGEADGAQRLKDAKGY